MNTSRTDSKPYEFDSYDNGRGWKNYDWIEYRTERDLTTAVWAIAFVGALAVVVGCVMGYQQAIIEVITNGLIR